ncbi:MAG: N-formylglutamate amidohydrolase [Candidatus Hodarchaeales archaeon]|jgi:N-formylglutamate amidohydrolase
MGILSITKVIDLREINKDERNLLLQNIYDPYHKAITKEVQDLLAKFGECFIIDTHSFPAIPLPYEDSQESKRPQICIGTDPYHTPEDLIQLTPIPNIEKICC